MECLFERTACGAIGDALPTGTRTLRVAHYRGNYGGYVYEIDYVHYPVSTGFGFTLPFGHAGVLAIDPNGTTRYFEYGRYATNFGQVRRRRIPDVTIGPDHWPTAESMRILFAYLSSHFGKDSKVRATYCPGGNYSRTFWFAINRKRDTHRRAYSWNPLNPNDCKTFVAEALAAGVGSRGWSAGGRSGTALDLAGVACAPPTRKSYDALLLTWSYKNSCRRFDALDHGVTEFRSRPPPWAT